MFLAVSHSVISRNITLLTRYFGNQVTNELICYCICTNIAQVLNTPTNHFHIHMLHIIPNSQFGYEKINDGSVFLEILNLVTEFDIKVL